MNAPSEDSYTVDFATCSDCVAGYDGGICAHVFAVLLVLEEERVSKAGAVSRTSLPCTWGPRQRNVEPEPIVDVVVEKPVPESHRKKPPLSYTLYDARGPNVRSLTATDIQTLQQALRPDCPMRALLTSGVGNTECDLGPVPFGSCLSYQRPKKAAPATQASNTSSSCPTVSMPALPLPGREVDCSGGFTWPIALIDAQMLERETVGQATNAKWLQYHKSTLTASNFWRLCHRQKNPESMVAGVFDGPSLDHVPAIRHGRDFEDVALQAYMECKTKEGHPVDIRRCGLALYPQAQFIGASPDGMVFDATASPCFGLVEVKCPYSAFQKGLSAHEAAEQDQNFCLLLKDRQLHMKRNHHYYWQVQGQMAVTGATWCDFVVWLGEDTPLFTERIAADDELWASSILPALQEFYSRHALPYLKQRGRRHAAEVPSASVEHHLSVSATGTLVSPGESKLKELSKSATSPGVTPLAASLSRYESLLPFDQCQSRIDQRNGSNACTVICLMFVCDFISTSTMSFTPDSLRQIMRAGNTAYDSLHSLALLSADEALESLALGAELMHETFVWPTFEAFESLLQDSSLFSQASDKGCAGGVFVITPVTFAFCCREDTFVLFDSHSHQSHDALLAQVPMREASRYLAYFFATHYGYLHFDGSSSSNVHGHLTYIRLV